MISRVNSYNLNTQPSFTAHGAQTDMNKKQKRIVLASAIAGTAPVLALLAHKKGFSLNPAKILKTPIKDWAIFKYKPVNESIQYHEKEILGVAAGSVAGGFIGGCLVDKKENRKAKQREILSQMVGNIAVPVFLVGQGARLYSKYENRIENAVPQFNLNKISNGALKKVAGFTNKFMKVLPNATCTLAFLGVGIYVGNKVSNFINEKIYKKEVDREIRTTDFAPHFDDLCMAISMMNKSSSVGSLLGRFIPLALLVPGYQTGITQEDK